MLISEVDKRSFSRLPVDCKVIYKKPGQRDVLQGRGKNLSGNGILFVTDRAITVGTELEVNVLPGSKNHTPLNAIIKVVRMEPSSNAAQFSVAGEIQTILS
jgi:hypothetical protein